MPVTPTYPGVYIEEVPSGVHPITGVATSITAFVGFAQRGPVNEPTMVQSFPEFIRVFGGLVEDSTMSYAVQQFFLNGGHDALIVRCARLAGGGTLATRGSVTVGGGGTKNLTLRAANEGSWSADLRVRIDHDTKDKDEATPELYNVSIKDVGTGFVEVIRNLPLDGTAAALIEQQSVQVRATTTPTARPDDHADTTLANPDPFDPAFPARFDAMSAGVDGTHGESDLVPAADNGLGVYSLARADLFNLLCIPPVLHASDTGAGRVLGAAAKGRAAAFCEQERAFFIVDPHPDWIGPAQITAGGIQLSTYIANIGSDDRRNAGIYFPYLRAPDPLQDDAIADFPPCGAIAGVMARTDGSRGVWKAPAGLEAGLSGVQELKAKLTDGENGILNPRGVNCLRTFAASGHVVWGARTLQGDNALASEWKYVPVRRLALFLEESLYRGTQWVVFEPNDEPLWAQIRLNVGAFMHNLFRQGAFQGTTPREAYLVKCDKETTTQTDRNNGVVNILVGFAPLKPAEFVIIRIQQLAGQIET
ncbi:MAG TPA: phage tail sheath C-terminal domain-containing protein [Gaiellaceae bacterium]|nr:phage tail sheath C-terminal domain-containing protein [Gaiellaceae bacterium]